MRKLLTYTIFMVMAVCGLCTVQVQADTVEAPVLTVTDNDGNEVSKFTIKKGKQKDLDPVVEKAAEDEAEYTVSWTSSNKEVATVSKSGVVKAVGGGTATIKATVKGTEVVKKVKVSVQADPKLTIINDDKEEVSKVTMKKNQKYDLDYKIKKYPGDDNTYKMTWKSSNEKVATVSKNGNITAKKNGTTTITATIKGTKISKKIKVTVKKNVSIKYGAKYDKKVTVSSLKKKTGSTATDNMGNIYKKGKSLGKFVLTGYCTKCNSGYGRGTASGKTATAGVTVAVNRNQIKLGTKIIIGNHVYVAQDTHGNRRHSKVIDVFFGTRHGSEPFLKNIPVYLAK